jgi:uncharacterized membrane protein YfcA
VSGRARTRGGVVRGLHLAIGLLLSAAIGLSLGLIGGGSIITVPALIYVIGVEPHEAVGVSIAVVGMTAQAHIHVILDLCERLL